MKQFLWFTYIFQNWNETRAGWYFIIWLNRHNNPIFSIQHWFGKWYLSIGKKDFIN